MFLTPEENSMMKDDFNNLLNAADAVVLTIRYQVPVNPEVDPVYGHVNADEWESKTIVTRAIQQFIKPRDLAIRDWGKLEVGDCIFWVTENIDLELVDYDTATFETSDSLQWKPVPDSDLGSAREYAIFRSQIGQIAQMIPCKLRIP